MILNVFFLQIVAVKGCRAVTVDIPTEVLFFSAKIRCRKAWVLNQSWASCKKKNSLVKNTTHTKRIHISKETNTL